MSTSAHGRAHLGGGLGVASRHGCRIQMTSSCIIGNGGYEWWSVPTPFLWHHRARQISLRSFRIRESPRITSDCILTCSRDSRSSFTSLYIAVNRHVARNRRTKGVEFVRCRLQEAGTPGPSGVPDGNNLGRWSYVPPVSNVLQWEQLETKLPHYVG